MRAPIVVALYNQNPAGDAIAPEAKQLEVWRRRIARMGDPFMSLDGLVSDPPRAADRGFESAGQSQA